MEKIKKLMTYVSGTMLSLAMLAVGPLQAQAHSWNGNGSGNGNRQSENQDQQSKDGSGGNRNWGSSKSDWTDSNQGSGHSHKSSNKNNDGQDQNGNQDGNGSDGNITDQSESGGQDLINQDSSSEEASNDQDQNGEEVSGNDQESATSTEVLDQSSSSTVSNVDSTSTVSSSTSTVPAVSTSTSSGVSEGKPFGQGMVTFAFDDGYASQYDLAKPILDKAGVKATFFVITGSIGQTPLYMTKDQILNLKNDGMEIGGHTQTHTDLSTLTSDQIQVEVKGSKTDLETLLGSPVASFTYPYGVYNQNLLQVVQDAGYLGARTTDEGYNGIDGNRFALNDRHIESGVTADQVKSWIDEAVKNKQWLILEAHEQDGTGQYSNTTQTLQTIMDYVKSSGVKTVTMQEGLQLMGQ